MKEMINTFNKGYLHFIDYIYSIVHVQEKDTVSLRTIAVYVGLPMFILPYQGGNLTCAAGTLFINK